MSDGDPAILQVEEALADVIRNWPALADWSVLTGHAEDVAFDDTQSSISLTATRWTFSQDFMQGQTRHEADFELEVVSAKSGAAVPTPGAVRRRNFTAIAHIIAAVAAARSAPSALTALIEDIQEVDIAGAGPMARDVDATSLLFTVVFLTPRDDWFTLLT